MSAAVVQPVGWLKTFLLIPYFILILAGMVVPSDGSHGLLNIKALAFVFTIFSISTYALMAKKLNQTQWRLACYIVSSFLFLWIWYGIALLRDETPLNSAWEELKIFWLTISVVVITYYLYTEKLLTFQKLLKTVIYGNLAYSTVKVAMILLLAFGAFDMFGLMTKLGIRFMSMDISGKIPRFQTSMDIATPFLFFFFLKAERFGISWNKKISTLFLTISSCAILLSFSRFLTFVALLSIMLHAISVQNYVRAVLKSLVVVVLIIAAGVAWIGVEEADAIVARRLFSTENYRSDYIRKQQITAMIDEYEKVPLIGKGLGGYAPEVIRDKQLLYSYEVQWVAFLMQFGLVGLLCILGSVGIIGKVILTPPLSREKGALFFLFLAWLAAGFTNPFLISLSSGILYSLFLLAGYQLQKQNELTTYEKN
jgi:hypothetical protein